MATKKPYEAPAIIEECNVKELEEMLGARCNPCAPSEALDTKDKNKREG
ncbi:MAG: hypothetical protein V3V74_07515 [Nitrosomonadaceae bacterium]